MHFIYYAFLVLKRDLFLRSLYNILQPGKVDAIIQATVKLAVGDAPMEFTFSYLVYSLSSINTYVFSIKGSKSG